MASTSKTDEFLENVCGHVRCRAMHADIKAELLSHILEIKERLTAAGKPENEAEENALREMGDAGEIGLRLDKIHRPKPEWSVIFLAAAIIVVGFASFNDLFLQIDPTVGVKSLLEYMIFAVAGAAGFIAIYFIDLKKILRFSLPIYTFAVVIISTFVFCFRNADTLYYPYLPFVTVLFAIEALSLAFVLHQYRNCFKILLFTSVLTLASALVFTFSFGLMWAMILFLTFAFTYLKNLNNTQLKKPSKTVIGVFAAVFLLCDLLLFTFMTVNAVIHISRNDNNVLFGFTHAKFIGKVRIEQWTPVLGCSISNILQHYGYLFAFLIFIALLAFIFRVFQSSTAIKDKFYHNIALLTGLLFTFEVFVGLFDEAGVYFEGQTSQTFLPFLSHDISSYMLNMILLAVFLSCYRRKNITPSAQPSGLTARK